MVVLSIKQIHVHCDGQSIRISTGTEHECLPLHDVAHTFIVHCLLAAIVQEGVELERIVFSHVVHDAHGRILLYITIDGSRLRSNDELIVSEVSRRPRTYTHAYSRSHHGAVSCVCRKNKCSLRIFGLPSELRHSSGQAVLASLVSRALLSRVCCCFPRKTRFVS